MKVTRHAAVRNAPITLGAAIINNTPDIGFQLGVAFIPRRRS